MDTISEAASLFDKTGASSILKEGMKGNKGGVALAAIGGVLGSNSSGRAAIGMSVEEGANLVSRWGAGNFKTVARSIMKHFDKHGQEVGASSVW